MKTSAFLFASDAGQNVCDAYEMPPASDGVRMVGCALSKLVPDATHLEVMRGAVLSVHRATILATELLNMHLRRCLAGTADTDLSSFFDGSWILNAYNEITTGKKTVKVISALRQTRDEFMPPFSAPDRTGIQQCLLYDARNLAAVAATGVSTHFRARVLSHVRRRLALSGGGVRLPFARAETGEKAAPHAAGGRPA